MPKAFEVVDLDSRDSIPDRGGAYEQPKVHPTPPHGRDRGCTYGKTHPRCG